jgi:hypothetical protein
MKTDPLYEEVSPRLRSLSTSELRAEERLAQEALTRLVLEHMDDPNYEDIDTVSSEVRLLETQLILNLRVRDETVNDELRREMTRSGGSVTPQVEEMMRSLANSTFGREIDRAYSQLIMCREKLARWH